MYPPVKALLIPARKHQLCHFLHNYDSLAHDYNTL